jgi:hypothetical protein
MLLGIYFTGKNVPVKENLKELNLAQVSKA